MNNTQQRPMKKKRRRDYIIDTDTPNISFIQTALDLKKLGVKNYTFFLKLYDPSLKGVDPFSKNLTEEQIFRIVTECMRNPWYFLRECCRIPDQGNPSGVPYLLNRANLAATWCILHGIDTYLVIPRQIGKTQSVIAIIDWAFLLGTTNSEVMFINMVYDKAVENLTRLKDQRDLLPPYLQFKVSYDDDGKEIRGMNNVRKITNASNGNSIVTKPSATSVAKAEMIGRGSTQPIQYYDEVEFTPFIKTIMEAAGPAFKTASDNAKRNKGLYGRIFTSTPGDLDTGAGSDAAMIVENTARWTEKYYDMPIEDVKESISKNSSNDIVYIEYQYQQLGKDENWFNDVCKLLNNNPLKIKREIFLMRLHGSSESPFAPEDIEAISELRGKIKEQITINKLFILNLYESLEKNKCYFVGVDVSSGGGDDNSAVTIWDPYTKKTVGEFRSPYIGVKDLIKFLYILVRKYIPKCLLIIERNANGEAVLDHLRSDPWVSHNLYFDSSKDIVGDDVDDRLDAKGFLQSQAIRRKIYGVYTQKKSREKMFDILETHVREEKEGFVGHYVIDDINKLVRKNNKIQAGAGFHDDSIMSYLLCLYVYYYGTNLHRFGFMRGADLEHIQQETVASYSEVLDAMSDNDREFFQDVNPRSYDAIMDKIDIKKKIEETRGLITAGELQESIGRQNNYGEEMLSHMDQYEREIYFEMKRAEKESLAFNRAKGLRSSYENMNDDIDDYDFDDNLFADLNS